MTWSEALTWTIDNKEWIFSGIGVAVITGVTALLIGRQRGVTQRQTSGANSTNVQAGRDINVNQGRTGADDERSDGER